MRKQIFNMLLFVVVINSFSSYTTLNHAMREPNTRVNLSKSDFTLSEQVSAKAKTRKVLGIDWSSLFNNKTGTVDNNGYSSISLVSIPVIENYVADKTANYSLYE